MLFRAVCFNFSGENCFKSLYSLQYHKMYALKGCYLSCFLVCVQFNAKGKKEMWRFSTVLPLATFWKELRCESNRHGIAAVVEVRMGDSLWASMDEMWRWGAELFPAPCVEGEFVLPVHTNNKGLLLCGVSQALQPFQSETAALQGSCVLPLAAAVWVELGDFTPVWWAPAKISTSKLWNLQNYLLL